jgi:hypothetical protein
VSQVCGRTHRPPVTRTRRPHEVAVFYYIGLLAYKGELIVFSVAATGLSVAHPPSDAPPIPHADARGK